MHRITTQRLSAISCLFVLALTLALTIPAVAQAATLTVTWQSNTEPDLAGYKIYYGTASGQYGVPISVDAATTSYQLTNLNPNTTYYVALTAFNLAGFESGFSDEASATTLADGGQTWGLTTATSPVASGSVSPASGTYNDGQQVSLTATPAAGYAFDHWGGDAAGSNNPVTVTMNAAKSVTAYFTAITYTLTTSTSGSGSVSRNPNAASYNSGTQVALTATPAAGYAFDHWGGNASGSANPVTVTMSAAKTVTAYFTAITYTLTTSTSGSGSVTRNPNAASYASGTQVALTATPAAGYQFDHWGGDAAGSANPVTVTMSANKSVTAYFAALPTYTLAASVNPAGSGSVSPASGTYSQGAQVTVTAQAASGWRFDHWGGDAAGGSSSATVNMTANRTLTAYFARMHFTRPSLAAGYITAEGSIDVAGAPAQPGDEVAVYDPDGVCCGVAVVTTAGSYGPVTINLDNPATTADEGYVDGDRLNFKVWDASAEAETVSHLQVAGQAGNTYEINLEACFEERISLQPGWNLVSFSTATCYYASAQAPTAPMLSGVAYQHVANINAALASIDNKYEAVRSFDAAGAHTYRPDAAPELNDLDYLAPGYGYWIKATEACELVLTGGRVSPLASLELQAGWNLVGYWGHEVTYTGQAPAVDFAAPPAVQTTSEVASANGLFAAIEGMYRVVNSFDTNGAHTYRPGLPGFVTDLRYAGPGYGYWVCMNGAAALSY